MNTHHEQLSQKLFERNFNTLTTHEQHVIKHVSLRKHVSRNTNREFEDKLTFGQRIADRVASFGGSWTFILLFLGMMVLWVGINTFVLAQRNASFDPYPYILLNLVLSMLAAMQAPVIMMSQNRQAEKDRLNAAHDYEVNLKAELEILGLHEKVDTLREKQWSELVVMQQQQIELLTQLINNKK